MALDPRYKAVGLDMDGTFMNTKIDYMKLGNVIFDELVEIGVPPSAIIRNRGSKAELESGIAWLKRNGMSDEAHTLNERISKRSTSVEMEYCDVSRPFEGATEAVKALKREGYKVGILTRGGHSYAECILRKSNVLDLFDAIIARDDFPNEESKPSPKAMVNLGNALGVKPEEILFLGDHEIDWLTARDSGAGFYGVLTGGFRLEDWRAADERISVIEGVASLLKMMRD
ncbi:MAG: HAD family hydrolase [Candidatus Methanoplasma sp.]|jgi:phosphoglycolate phosphatase|nr:HAD family hydrolase [Candidatus Methanoplasma sp.]